MNAVFSGKLIFRWPERSASLVLPSLFVLSVAVHALAFYLFQVVYPPTVSIAPPPAQVTLLNASTPENRALLRWVDAQNPAKNDSIQDLTPPGLGDVYYTPSYATAQTSPKPVEHLPEAVAFPTVWDSLALSSPPAEEPYFTPKTVPSSLAFSENLQSRDLNPGAPITLASKTSANLKPSQFLIGVSDRGEIRFCFLQASSDDPAIDREGESILRQRDFRPVGAGSDVLSWGFATFTWGAQVFKPAGGFPASSASE